MIRTWTSKDKTHIRIKCPTCELGIEIEPKEEHRWQELLEEAKKQWIKVKSKEVEKDKRIAEEISSMFEKNIRKTIHRHRGKAVRELLRIICGTLAGEVDWYHSFPSKLAEEEIEKLKKISSVILDSCFKVQNIIEGGDSK